MPLFAGAMELEELEKAAVLFVKIVYFVGGLQATFLACVATLATILRWSNRVSFLAVVVASVVAGIVAVMVMDCGRQHWHSSFSPACMSAPASPAG